MSKLTDNLVEHFSYKKIIVKWKENHEWWTGKYVDIVLLSKRHIGADDKNLKKKYPARLNV
jgi:hypothetical protein